MTPVPVTNVAVPVAMAMPEMAVPVTVPVTKVAVPVTEVAVAMGGRRCRTEDTEAGQENEREELASTEHDDLL
ncbi:protein of unknown function [Methylorubrum extorquens]|uniref:Uncharacterized protein n=1 Tax=Methylorubrum extorquens TaxID=408 RepID=A0A2N9ATI9_METEX|nr:protein of unknown function [Methylorubrum extorquens]